MTATAAPSLRQHIRGERIKLPKQYFERSVAWTVLFAARPFLWITAALVLAGAGTWIAWPAAVAALLVAQRHFQTLVHDASHNFYYRTTRINDLLANWLAAGWIGMTVENYRRIHFQHHAHNGSADDPEHVSFATVASEGSLWKMVLRYACLLEVLRLIEKYYGSKAGSGAAGRAGAPKKPLVPLHIVGAQTLLAATCWSFGLAALYPVWLYLAVTWSPLLSRLRFLVEHPARATPLSAHDRRSSRSCSSRHSTSTFTSSIMPGPACRPTACGRQTAICCATASTIDTPSMPIGAS